MSERRLRELGTFDTEGGVERCAFCHALVSAGEHYPQCPVDDDPDVVAVARVCREYDPGPAKTRGSKLYNEGWRDAVNAVADNLERKYGFILTDKGYEWTEEVTE